LPAQPRRQLAHGTVEVQPGDTLYALSRRHGVSISALMDTNQLKSLTLVPGQVLKLPPQSRPRG
jgi:LysM repeat protein